MTWPELLRQVEQTPACDMDEPWPVKVLRSGQQFEDAADIADVYARTVDGTLYIYVK
jgi:hypothetical protein